MVGVALSLLVSLSLPLALSLSLAVVVRACCPVYVRTHAQLGPAVEECQAIVKTIGRGDNDVDNEAETKEDGDQDGDGGEGGEGRRIFDDDRKDFLHVLNERKRKEDAAVAVAVSERVRQSVRAWVVGVGG